MQTAESSAIQQISYSSKRTYIQELFFIGVTMVSFSLSPLDLNQKLIGVIAISTLIFIVGIYVNKHKVRKIIISDSLIKVSYGGSFASSLKKIPTGDVTAVSFKDYYRKRNGDRFVKVFYDRSETYITLKTIDDVEQVVRYYVKHNKSLALVTKNPKLLALASGR